ncbi:MFS transporter [Streptomyces alkaliphilus]|uniref:MFS transporter n=1 Tax=Streptomyces alkaliphilus TaxID=1472722 RepID=UPI00117C7D6D|nr:MFS transporter [Streptomyces alkaliphilus]MQS05748.1 MFS transporter [Streptomyces alkaliphilus]
MAETPARARTRSELWRDFAPTERREVATVVVSTLQSQSTSALLLLLLSVLALDLTGTAASAPLVVAAGALPPLLLVRWVRLVNRWMDHRWVMMLSDLGAFTVTLVLYLLLRGDDIEAWHIYLGMFLFSSFGAFYLPAMRGWVADQTSGIEQLTWLNAMLAVASQASVVVGWALGGVLVSTIGITASLAICALSYVFGIVLQFIVFVLINRAPFRRAGKPSAPSPGGGSGVAGAAGSPARAGFDVWRDVFSFRRLGLFTAALLLMELTHILAFSMFVPLLTDGAPDRSWIAGTANACFALAAMLSGLLVSGGTIGRWARSRVPQIVLVGFCVQAVFGLGAGYAVLAIVLYTIVGLLSGGDAALQSEVQDRWRPVGSAQAFAVFGAVLGPAQLVGSLLVAFLLLHLPVTGVYVGTVLTLGLGSGLMLLLARRRAPAPSPETREPLP